MSQAPATPKGRRRALLTLAALLGPRAVMDRPGLAASERAALRLRAARPATPPERPETVFLIPLVGRAQVGDWDAVTGRLARTVASFRRQDGAWRALVCGQDRPDLGPDIGSDPRLRFLPFERRVDGNDKWEKLADLCAALPGLGVPQGYAMPFDADDLLRPGTVAEMAARRAPGGYLARTGFVRDVSTGTVALAGPPGVAAPLRKPFWKLCGSCAAFAFDFRADTFDAEFLAAATAHEHRMFPYLSRLAGRPLAPLSRPSVLYELNHGENFGARRGRVGFKTRFVERFALRDPAAEAEIARDFG